MSSTKTMHQVLAFPSIWLGREIQCMKCLIINIITIAILLTVVIGYVATAGHKLLLALFAVHKVLHNHLCKKIKWLSGKG